MKILTPRLLTISTVILAGALSRLLPHPGNFSPVAAIALLGGAYIQDKRFAYLVPVLMMMLSDLFIPFGFNPVVYACFIGVVFIGTLLGKNINPKNIILSSLSASVLFFLVTNLPFWYTNPKLYTNDFAGLVTSYTVALPFFMNTILGDLFFSGTFFFSFYLLKRKFPILA